MLRPVIPALFLALACATPAGAAPPSSQGTASALPSTVADILKRAERARNARRWGEAIEAYKEALAEADRAGVPFDKTRNILGELGLCELAMEKYVDAATHLREAAHGGGLRYHKADIPADIRYHNGWLKAENGCSLIYVAANPPDATITIDGKDVDPLHISRSYAVYVEPGPHVIRASLAGHTDAMQETTIPRGEFVTISMHLAPLPPPPKEPTAAPGPVAPPRKEPAVARAASHDGGTDLRKAALVTAGVGAALGTGLLLSTIPVNNAIKERMDTFGKRAGYSACYSPNRPPECDAQEASLSARAWLTGLGWAAVGVSGTIASITAVSYLWNDVEGCPAPIRVAPVATGQFSGIAAIGAW